MNWVKFFRYASIIMIYAIPVTIIIGIIGFSASLEGEPEQSDIFFVFIGSLFFIGYLIIIELSIAIVCFIIYRIIRKTRPQETLEAEKPSERKWKFKFPKIRRKN